MWNLAKETTRGFTKKITQFIGLILFIIGAVLTFTALFSTVFQVKNGLNDINKNSLPYQYKIRVDSLNIDNNVWKRNPAWKINENNCTFLAQFYNESKIDAEHLTFNNIRADVLGLNCDLTNSEICKWTKEPSYLNPEMGTASFTALVKNFNKNLTAAFLSYIIHNPDESLLNDLINGDKVGLELSFNVGYQFTANNLAKDTQYFNATAVNKNKNLLYNGDGWRGNNIFYTPFNRLFEVTKWEHISDLTENNIILNKQYANYNHLKLGGHFNLGNSQNLQFNIIGYGAKVSNIYPDLVSLPTLATGHKIIDLKNGSVLFMNDINFNAIKQNFSNGTEKITSFINVNGNLTEPQKITLLRKVLSNYFVAPDNAIVAFEASLPGQVVMLTNTGFIINTLIAVACSIIILFIIAFFIKKDITNAKRQIGVLKSLGYHRFELSFIFTFNIIFTTLIGCLLGWALSIPLQMYFTGSNLYSIGLPLSSFYFNPLIFVSATIFIPLIFIGMSFLISFILLSRTALDLIYDLKGSNLSFRPKKLKKGRKYAHFGLTFNVHLSFTFALKSLGKWIMVLIVLAFSFFLLIFQLDAGVMAQGIVKDSFRYFKNDIKSYLIASYDQQDIAQEASNSKTYQWITADKRMNYYHEAKILDDNKTFNFPNPLMCFTSLSVSDSKNMKKNCGDLLNIIGDPSGATLVRSKINYDEETKTYPYISATTVEAVANYKVKDNESGEWINGWDNLVKIINLMKPFLIEKGINEADIQTIISGINLVNSLSTTTNVQYPDIYLGQYMVYNKNYDFPYVFLSAGWSPDDTKNSKNPVSQLNVVGLTSDETERNQLLNYRSKTTPSDIAQKEVFGYKISSDPTGNDSNVPINEPIPVLLAKRVYQSMNLVSGDIFKLNVRITNAIGYVPVAFKVIGSNDADISSGNIYMNQDSLVTVMNQWVNLTKKGEQFLPNPYYNVVASRASPLGVTLQPYRIISSFSLNDNYDFTMFDNNKKPDLKNALDLRTNLKLLNGINKIWPFDTLRENYSQGMRTVRDVLNVLEGLTIVIVALILSVLIAVVLDENRRTILTLKVLGYPTWKIIAIVLGFYLFAIVLGYVLSYVIAQLLWNVIAHIVFKSTGMLLIPSFSSYVVSIATLAIGFILISVIGVGIWKIKKNKL
ncbi:ABC transporter permease [Spiroplasma endosymbiont of Megaselia nigra]|uniref:ABC transporter permease n=1 Tax=Spiroplasma endosymbiont of Megaselia nigra TaxID=2478537 RepID=UPI000F87CE90|nr:ABC transporter permease [Spiroplasma endosymbiont of Megaselia nigra]RUO86210.1 ABC transporter permease [Spiroplasma endosymbiont of Megaselia nigra]